MASFASSGTTGGARKHAWTKKQMRYRYAQLLTILLSGKATIPPSYWYVDCCRNFISSAENYFTQWKEEISFHLDIILINRLEEGQHFAKY